MKTTSAKTLAKIAQGALLYPRILRGIPHDHQITLFAALGVGKPTLAKLRASGATNEQVNDIIRKAWAKKSKPKARLSYWLVEKDDVLGIRIDNEKTPSISGDRLLPVVRAVLNIPYPVVLPAPPVTPDMYAAQALTYGSTSEPLPLIFRAATR